MKLSKSWSSQQQIKGRTNGQAKLCPVPVYRQCKNHSLLAASCPFSEGRGSERLDPWTQRNSPSWCSESPAIRLFYTTEIFMRDLTLKRWMAIESRSCWKAPTLALSDLFSFFCRFFADWSVLKKEISLSFSQLQQQIISYDQTKNVTKTMVLLCT